MQYTEFYQYGFGTNAGKLFPACGSDSVLKFDGRWGLDRCAAEARRHMAALNRGIKRGAYKGFTINAGRSFTDSRIIRKLEIVKES